MTKTDALIDYVKSVTGAHHVQIAEQVQQLWSGYGHITRLNLNLAGTNSVIVKVVNPPGESQHPRGWNTDVSHLRKLRSYEVEVCWYTHWIGECIEAARVAACFGCASIDGSQVIVLEDLDATYPRRAAVATVPEAIVCLQWLASFHARFMGREPIGLWPVGSYWHLATRQDEWRLMTHAALKEAAQALDGVLSGCKFQTLVHGDAKIANFCFQPVDAGSSAVAAVDFQYVGGGCGIKDVVYFLGSCLSESDCERYEERMLDEYFAALADALALYHPDINAQAVESEWRGLYAIAWTDFYRFLDGWMPSHPKVHSYTRKLARQALEQLQA